MTLPALPSPGSTDWYDHYTGLHAAADEVINGRLSEGELGNPETRHSVNVADHGAVGDWNGSSGTNNLAAFDAAVAEMQDTGWPILIPAGRYWLSDNWLIDGDDVAVYCHPGAEIITTSPTTTGAAVTFMGGGVLSPNDVSTPQRGRFVWRGGKVTAQGSGTADNALGVVRVRNCHIADVTVDADRKGLTAQYGIDNIVWERIKVTRAGTDGITVETACNRVTLRDITVEDADDAGVRITSGDAGQRCTDVLLDQVDITTAGTNGVSIGLTDRITVRKTRVASAGSNGLYVADTTGLSITGDCSFPSVTFGASVTSKKPAATAIPLESNWVTFGAPHAAPTAYRTSDGMVVLDGAMKSGSISAGARIGTLPAGHRPPHRVRFMAVNAGGAAATADLYAEPTGAIHIAQALGSSVILSLSGIVFPAA